MTRSKALRHAGLSAISMTVVACLSARAADITVEADVSSLDAGEQYVALILDYDNNIEDNLLIKLIVDPNTGRFAAGQFAHGRDEGPWPNMGTNSFFGIDQPFFTAHFAVTRLDTGGVIVELTNLDGNPNLRQLERRVNWQIPGRKEVGFAANGGKIAVDNFVPRDGVVCDTFDRDNGDIGRLWRVEDGTATIQSDTARGDDRAFAIWISEDCNACSGIEKFTAKCKDKNGSNVLTTKVTKGFPGGLVAIFDQNSGEGEELTINNRGKAKRKFNDAESGLHFVFASFPCGYTLEVRPTCP